MAAQKRLNRDELVTTALAVADTEGLDAVTVRRVAQQHDVTPMALYRHFTDKDGILDAIAERLLEGVRIPAPDDRPWDAQMHDLLAAFVDALRPHPNVAVLLFARVMSCEAGLVLTERALDLLAEAGLSTEEGAETSCQALASLITLVISEPGRLHGPDPEAHDEALRAKRALLLTLSPVRYPRLVAAADALVDCASPDVFYRRGLRLIVTGMRGAANSPERVG